MAFVGDTASHKMAARAYLQSHSKDPCIVVAVAAKAAV